MSQFHITREQDADSAEEFYTITRDDGHGIGKLDLEALRRLSDVVTKALKEAEPHVLPDAAEGLEPRGGIGFVRDINGPDGGLMDFQPTRAELQTLAYHYLDRYYIEKLCHAMGYSGSSEWREYDYTWRRFVAIEEVLSPDGVFQPFSAYIEKKKKEVNEDLVDAPTTFGFEVMPSNETVLLTFYGSEEKNVTRCVRMPVAVFRELIKTDLTERVVFDLPQEVVDDIASQTAARITERNERVRQEEQRIAEAWRTNTGVEEHTGDQSNVEFLQALEEMETQQVESEALNARHNSAQEPNRH